MKLGCAMGLGLALVMGAGTAAQAQGRVSAYGEFSASKLTNLDGTTVLYGPSIGVIDSFGDNSRLRFGLDLRGTFVGGARRLDGLAFGPRVATHFKSLEPYAELLVGFARYNDGLGNKASGTTDGQLQVVGGLDRKITPRFDLRIFEFGYAQYYALGGQFNPKTFSTGVVYHFVKR